ncbi:hypothetical protein E2542_SST17355 [Spatholobus suberectus]|nr:hypothetical protein E2542_SST17355 [Spatholobus suberectus]
MLVAGVLIGAWDSETAVEARVCGDGEGRVGGELAREDEKLEEDLKSSATVVRVLSRQLEKLGVRFRVTRKALKDP